MRRKKIFWAFTSASTNPKTSFMFLGNDENDYKTGTIFSFTGDVWGYDISLFNVYNEEEILLEPEREIEVEESLPPLNNIIYVRCRIKKTPLVLEDILKQKINLNDDNDIDLEENLNINHFINEKNEKKVSKKKEIVEPLSINNKVNNQKKYDILNTEPQSPKYSNLTFNNKNKKSLKYSYSQIQFNTINNNKKIKNNINNKEKHKFSFSLNQSINSINDDINNQNLNKKELLNEKNSDNINNNKINSSYLSTESNLKKHTKSLLDKNGNNSMSNSNIQKNLLSNKKYNTIDDNEVKNKEQNNKKLEFITITFDFEKKIFQSNKIYYGKDEYLNKEFAVKIEKPLPQNSLLEYEYNIYKILQGGEGIPKIYSYGSQKNYNFLAMDLLDKSLNFYFNSCERKFSLLTTLMLADQMLSLIEFIHEKSFVYCNLKLVYFIMGRDSNKHKVYLINFRRAKKYIDPKTKLLIPYNEENNFMGNFYFSSINQLSGIEVSRRDDIEALGYIFVYFLKGDLPWSNIKYKTCDEGIEKALKIRINTSLDILCQGCPEEFKTFIQYSRDLKYDEKPNYGYLRELLTRIRLKNSLIFDYSQYDWLLKKNE